MLNTGERWRITIVQPARVYDTMGYASHI